MWGYRGRTRQSSSLALALMLVGFPMLGACGSDGRPSPVEGALTGGSGGATSGGAGGNGLAGAAQSGSGGSAVAGAGGMGGMGGVEGFVPPCIPRQACLDLCSSLGDDPASCGVGDAEECACICERRFNAPCPTELDALVACTGAGAEIDCTVRGRIFPGCEDESIALDLCDFRTREQLCAQGFPLCLQYCRAATLSFCSQGPESVSSCLCGCEASLATRCASDFGAFMSCSNDAPEFVCDGAGRPLSSGCSVEWQSLESCVDNSVLPGPDAAD